MKKIFSILLITVLIFGIIGYEIIFSLLLVKYKEDAEKIISSTDKNENEVVLIINSNNKNLLHWKDKHEVEFDGVMYDIRKEETKGESLILYAVMDVDEQNLVNSFKYENSNQKNDPYQKANEQFNQNNYNRNYLVAPTIRLIPRIIKSNIYLLSYNNYYQPDLELNTPPPRYFTV